MDITAALDIILEGAEARARDLSELLGEVDRGTDARIRDEVASIGEAVDIIASLDLRRMEA